MLSTLPLSAAVRGPSAKQRGWLCSDALREMPLKQWVKWPLKPGHCMMPPCPAEEPTLSCKMKKEEGGSWVLTIRQFFSVMKWSSQQGKSWPAGRTDGWLAVTWLALRVGVGCVAGCRWGGRLGGSTQAIDVILLQLEPFVGHLWRLKIWTGLGTGFRAHVKKKKIYTSKKLVIDGMRKNRFKRKWPSTCRVWITILEECEWKFYGNTISECSVATHCQTMETVPLLKCRKCIYKLIKIRIQHVFCTLTERHHFIPIFRSLF